MLLDFISSDALLALEADSYQVEVAEKIVSNANLAIHNPGHSRAAKTRSDAQKVCAMYENSRATEVYSKFLRRREV
jgi:hypothetical protein